MRNMVSVKGMEIIIISLMIIPIFSFSATANEATEITGSNILYVSKSGSTYSRIQDALDNATDGDTVIVGNGTYNEENLVIANSIILKGNSTSNTILLFNGNSKVFIKSYSDKVTVLDLNITTNGNNNTVLKFIGNRSIIRDCRFYTYSEWSTIIKTSYGVNNITIDSCYFHTVGNYSSNINISEKNEFIRVNNSDLNMVGMESTSCFLFDSCNIRIENSIFNSTYLNWWGNTKEYKKITRNYLLYGIKMEKLYSIIVYNISFFLEGRNLPHGSINCIGIYSKEYQSIDSQIYHSSNLKIDGFKGFAKWGNLFVLNNIKNINITNGLKTKDTLWEESIIIRNCCNIEYFNNNISSLSVYSAEEKCKVLNSRFLQLKVSSSQIYNLKDDKNEIIIRNNIVLNDYEGFLYNFIPFVFDLTVLFRMLILEPFTLNGMKL
jgi:hypothetical protein